jgi:hypothetical protein
MKIASNTGRNGRQGAGRADRSGDGKGGGETDGQEGLGPGREADLEAFFGGPHGFRPFMD